MTQPHDVSADTPPEPEHHCSICCPKWVRGLVVVLLTVIGPLLIALITALIG